MDFLRIIYGFFDIIIFLGKLALLVSSIIYFIKNKTIESIFLMGGAILIFLNSVFGRGFVNLFRGDFQQFMMFFSKFLYFIGFSAFVAGFVIMVVKIAKSKNQ